ncbi:hypothetical protein NL108_004537 [Boleophthalmus pectinirostris]|nr:hypothetical protein NL108_004537 [Boleophthalmus pectinirostris]
MYLQDVINKTNVCSLILPANHTLATSCNPVFALNSQHHSLLIQVVKEPLSTEDGNNQLYIFRFGECEIVKPCIITPSDSNEQNTCHFVTLNDLCNQHLQDRKLSAHERAKDIKQTWRELQETSMMIKQGYPTNYV